MRGRFLGARWATRASILVYVERPSPMCVKAAAIMGYNRSAFSFFLLSRFFSDRTASYSLKHVECDCLTLSSPFPAVSPPGGCGCETAALNRCEWRRSSARELICERISNGVEVGVSVRPMAASDTIVVVVGRRGRAVRMLCLVM